MPRTFVQEVWGQPGKNSHDTHEQVRAGARAALDQLTNLGLVVTSSYSGTGSYESVVHRIMNLAWETTGGKHHCAKLAQKKITFYSANDIDPVARDVIASHPACTRPMHLFGDILDRVPRSAMKELRGIERRCLLAIVGKMFKKSRSWGLLRLSLLRRRAKSCQRSTCANCSLSSRT